MTIPKKIATVGDLQTTLLEFSPTMPLIISLHGIAKPFDGTYDLTATLIMRAFDNKFCLLLSDGIIRHQPMASAGLLDYAERSWIWLSRLINTMWLHVLKRDGS